MLKKAETEKNVLTEKESKEILKRYGIPVVYEAVSSNTEEAIKVAQEIGFPVVLKGLGKRLLHKTERGLVYLNLTDSESVRRATIAIADEAGEDLEGFLVQPMISGNREFVAGLFRDEQFGPVVMFGLGGIFTEALSDITFRLAPINENDAVEMITTISATPLLGAFRGEKPVNQEQLIQTLMGLSEISLKQLEIAEIDINPLLITPKGEVIAVDALVIKDPKYTESKKINRETFSPVDPVLIGKFFHPKSVAFVGASSQMGKWGHLLLTITAAGGFKGDIYLVNPKGGNIAGKKVYPSVGDIPGKVDLAVVTIPAAFVSDLIPQFKAKGIQNMLLITSGFSEIGEAGKEAEKELVRKAKDAGILILGPNTMGVCNPYINLYCTGSHVRPVPGSTSVVAQSGNVATQLLVFAEQQKIGIRGFAGSGNEAMITIEDYIEAFEDDDKTQNIMLYIESVKNGRRFFDVCKKVGKKKPIVLLKGGRTAAGNRAATSHTGALASDSRIFEAVCKQAGIVNAEYPMDLLDLSAAFSSLPLPKGNRVAIMTFGGGWGVVAADLCAEHHIDVPELSPDITVRIDKILPDYWSRSNPIDMVGENDTTIPVVVLEELLKWDGCDAVINLGIVGRKNLLGRYIDSIRKADPTYTSETLDSLNQEILDFEKKYIEHIIYLMEKYQKPVFGVILMAKDEDQAIYSLNESRFKGVFYPTPERAVKAFAKMYEYRSFLNRCKIES